MRYEDLAEVNIHKVSKIRRREISRCKERMRWAKKPSMLKQPSWSNLCGRPPSANYAFVAENGLNPSEKVGLAEWCVRGFELKTHDMLHK
jgi:hypothetical protein